MIDKNNLEVGRRYWYVSSSDLFFPIRLTFKNKVEGRKAYRFFQDGRKKSFILHECRLTHLFSTYTDAKESLLVLVENLVNRHKKDIEAVKEGPRVLTAPNIHDWPALVAFPRIVKIGRR